MSRPRKASELRTVSSNTQKCDHQLALVQLGGNYEFTQKALKRLTNLLAISAIAKALKIGRASVYRALETETQGERS